MWWCLPLNLLGFTGAPLASSHTFLVSKRKGQETQPELSVSGMKSQGWVSGFPVSGRPPRGLTPTCSKGRCHSPAVLMEGHVARSTAGSAAPLCGCPGETVVCRADAHAGSCSFTLLVLCNLFFASMLAPPRNKLRLGSGS